MPGEYLPPVVTRLTMNIDDFIGGITKAKAALKALDGTADIVIDSNIDEIAAKVAALKAEFAALKNVDVNFDTNIDATLVKLALLKTALDAIDGQAANFKLNVDATAVAALAALNRSVTGFGTRLTNNIKKMNEWATASQIFGLYVDDLEVKMARLAATSQGVSVNMALMMTAMAGLVRAQTSDITRANAALIAAQAALLRSQNVASRAGQGGGGFGGGWWGLGGNVTPWKGTVLAKDVPVWHPVSHIVIESVIALAAAFTDLALAGAAMTPAAIEIGDRLYALRSVTNALGGSMSGLGGGITTFTRSLAGNTISAFGGVLNMFNKNGKQAEQVIRQVVIGLDDWIAKIDIFMNTRGGTGILTFGLNILHQFEGIANTMGVAFANIMKADPGTIHYLLNLVEFSARLLQLFTELPIPFVRTTLQIEAAWLYGGLLYNQLAKIPGVAYLVNSVFGKTGFLFGGITKNIQGATSAAGKFEAILAGGVILLAIAAVGFSIEQIVTHWDSASGAVNKYIATQNKALANMNAEQAFNNIPGMIGDVNKQISKVNPASLVGGMNSMSNFGNGMSMQFQAVANAWAQSGSTWGHLFHAFDVTFNPGMRAQAGAAVQAGHDVAAYRVQIQALSKDQQNLFGTMANVVKEGYGTQQSFALMNMAGVQASDSIQLATQKVNNLIAGYKQMGIQGALMQNSMNAVNFNTWLGDSNIANVTGGWTSFISTVTGGVTAFQTFEQGLLSTKTAAGAAGASITGLNANSLTLQQDFSTNVTNASAMINSLYTLAATAKLGTQGTNDITQATKDMVAQMLPAVGTNKALQDSLYALAQQGGYQGANSMKALSTWMGKIKQPGQQLEGIMTALTSKSANLAQDIMNLATAINPMMTNAMAQAIVQANGGTKALENWATNVVRGNGNMGQFVGSAQSMYKQLVAVYGATSNGKTEFEAFNQMLGISKGQSDRLWQALQSGSTSAIATIISQIQRGQAAIDSLHGKTIYINMVTTGSNIPATSQIPGVTAPLKSSSLPHHATGTPSAASGWGWVGEKGPELVKFRGGETVIPNHVARGYAAGAGNYGDAAHEVNVYLDGRHIYKTVQQRSVTRQRRSGSSGLAKRTR